MLKRLLPYIYKNKSLFLISLLLVLLSAAATLAPAEFGQHVIKKINKEYLAKIIKNNQLAEIFYFAGLGLLLVIAKVIFDFFRTYLMGYLGQKISVDMQKHFHKKMLNLPVNFFRNREIGDLISRTTNDISIVRTFLAGYLLNAIKDPLIIIFGVTILFIKSWVFTLELIVVGILILIIMQVIGNKLRKIVIKVQESLGNITAKLQRSLFSMEVIKIFNREKYHREGFNSSLDTYLDHTKKVYRLDATIKPLSELLMSIAALVIGFTGVYLIAVKQLESHELFGFIFYLAILSGPMNSLAHISVHYKKAMASASRIYEIFDVPDEKYNKDKKDLMISQGKVEFKDIYFSYKKGEPVLKGINLTAKPGKVIAIVGTSGGGKTTLVNLIPKLIEAQKGQINIDGQNIKNVSLSSLRQQISMVSQDNILFPGSVYDNILYGRLDATPEDVYEAAQMANAHEFIMNFPKGYKAKIGERGLLISGGQRQRLSLARAILRQPKIMILDEATSALDTESEKLVQEALSRILHHQTTFVIAHRLSTIQEADQILVMDKGVIAEKGTHTQLMSRKRSIYKKLYEMQFKI
ncbi:MAG: ABC transporter ATP-binding protein [Spirochaetes bacterium]|nr:ABC transporter ATP-binding protein [Spirochaetota bacterium]